MIAFTNHALDHMLCSVLDANITNKIVRLGRRATDERIAKYSIETLEMAKNHSRLDRTFNFRRDLKGIQDDIKKLMQKVLKVDIENDSTEITSYLLTSYPEHHEHFSDPPSWVSNARVFMDDNDEGAGEWQKAGPKGKYSVEDKSNYAFWKECKDLNFIYQVTSGAYSQPKPTLSDVQPLHNAFGVLSVDDVEDDQESDSEPDSDYSIESSHQLLGAEESWKIVQYDMPPNSPSGGSSGTSSSPGKSSTSQADPDINDYLQADDFQDIDAFFISLGFHGTPSNPDTDRSLQELIDNVGDVWTMSASERHRIHNFWVEETRNELSYSSTTEFERLRDLHAQKLEQVDEVKEEVCLKSILVCMLHSRVGPANSPTENRHHWLHNDR
jgi:hypothetical protein